MLSVLAPQHQFDTVSRFKAFVKCIFWLSDFQLRVDVLADSNIPEIRPYIPGTPLEPPAAVKLPYPIELQPRRHVSFFVPIESFNLMGMFQNPMMLLMGVTAIIAIGAPYLLVRVYPLDHFPMLMNAACRNPWILIHWKKSQTSTRQWRRCKAKWIYRQGKQHINLEHARAHVTYDMLKVVQSTEQCHRS